MQPSRGKRGKTKKPSRNDAYWQRLKQEFQTCVYENSGAYRELNGDRSPKITEIANEIEETEQVLLTDKHRELRKVGYFEANVPDHQKYLRALGHGK